MDGIETTRQILSALPATKILIFSSDSAGERVEEALQAGAHGFICKRRPVNDLIRAIDEVMAGELCLSPEMSAVIVENYQRKLVGKLAPPKSILLPREKQFCG
jgi:DNA-binding NarL/FixJ family response regulator